MLVLTRKQEESVVVLDPSGVEHVLKVKVLGINGGKVKLGFEVAKEFPVHRSEVWERIRAKCWPDRLTGIPAATVEDRRCDGDHAAQAYPKPV